MAADVEAEIAAMLEALREAERLQPGFLDAWADAVAKPPAL